MEWAEAHEIGTRLLELDVATDDLDDVGACDQFLDERGGDGHVGGERQMIRKPSNGRRPAAYSSSRNRPMIRRSIHHAVPLLKHPLRFMWEALKSFKANQGLLLAGA